MPSVSKKQHNLMEGIAKGWHPTGMKHPPPVRVAKEFAAADSAMQVPQRKPRFMRSR